VIPSVSQDGPQKTGAVLWPEAYAQGKVLDHSGWGAKGGGWMDGDMIREKRGFILWVELKGLKETEQPWDWKHLNEQNRGQVAVYEQLLRITKQTASGETLPRFIFCLCCHRVPRKIQIDTFHDIESAEVLLPNFETLNIGAEGFRKLGKAWLESPESAIKDLLSVPTFNTNSTY
jgi:hypothetical protein